MLSISSIRIFQKPKERRPQPAPQYFQSTFSLLHFENFSVVLLWYLGGCLLTTLLCCFLFYKMETSLYTEKSNLCECISTGCLCSHHRSLNLQTIVQCLPHVCFQVNTTTDGRFFHPAWCQYLSFSFHGCIIDFQQRENTWSSHAHKYTC